MVNILSIDDSKLVHTFLDRCFKERSNIYNVTHVLSGAEALKLLRNPANIYSLILLDWEMPKLTGPETLVEIRKMGITMPVVMVTTKNNPEDIQSMLELGVAEYILKPFTPDILFSKLDYIFESAA